MKIMKKTILVVLVLTLVLSSSMVAMAAESEIDYSQWDSSAKYPSDIANTKYAASVGWLVDKLAVTGDTDGLYHPENSINRAEFSKMMAIATNKTTNLEKLKTVDKFSDLSGYGWAKGYINCVEEAGIVKGIGGDLFAPGNNVTYVEVIAMIVRVKPGLEATVNGMGQWPDNYIKYAQMYNMIGDLVISDWNAPATKGDVAILMYRNLPK